MNICLRGLAIYLLPYYCQILEYVIFPDLIDSIKNVNLRLEILSKAESEYDLQLSTLYQVFERSWPKPRDQSILLYELR